MLVCSILRAVILIALRIIPDFPAPTAIGLLSSGRMAYCQDLNLRFGKADEVLGGQLTCAGVLFPAGGHVPDVLTVLANAGGGTVGKDLLVHQVWPVTPTGWRSSGPDDILPRLAHRALEDLP